MKKMMVMVAIMFGASISQAAIPVFSLTCKNENQETLEIVETAEGHGNRIVIPENVTATLYVFRAFEKFYGKVSGGGVVHTYNMTPTEDGQPVTLQVAAKVSFAANCGRCPPGQFPPKPQPATYFAKLTVGNSIHEFVCQ